MKKIVIIGGGIVICAAVLLVLLFSQLIPLPFQWRQAPLIDSATDHTGISGSMGACPSKIGISYFVQAKETASWMDDELYIRLFNPDSISYSATVLVDQTFEGEVLLNSQSNATILSSQMTTWWRGVDPGTDAPVQEAVEPSLGEQKSFAVLVRVAGCDEVIGSFSPSPVDTRVDKSGKGSVSEGITVRRITKPNDHD